ncbi:hypothetical protein Baya_12470 [Bagarius yarrelli]|uniref:Uncharacterized protein n=1 Tax=Bagarius yarrelli TaxID=175774 RepID=A0A556V3A6_BAGYA|nr:hypothetical protein Baya_12470 [Bagarius yarrelli]
MSKGSHFTCRCVTLVTFSGKVCFNSKSEEAGKGAGGTYGEQQQPPELFRRVLSSSSSKKSKVIANNLLVKVWVGGNGYLICLQPRKFVYNVIS